jgi:hypothetical protein
MAIVKAPRRTDAASLAMPRMQNSVGRRLKDILRSLESIHCACALAKRRKSRFGVVASKLDFIAVENGTEVVAST